VLGFGEIRYLELDLVLGDGFAELLEGFQGGDDVGLHDDVLHQLLWSHCGESDKGSHRDSASDRDKGRNIKGVAKVSIENLSQYYVLLSKVRFEKKTAKTTIFTLLESGLPSPQQSVAAGVRE
jgi:hypothetical protein